MDAIRIERLSSPQIPAVQALIGETAHTRAPFSVLVRYCLVANASAFVALGAGREVVGIIGGSETDGVALIECLCVDGAHRNLGIATRLIDVFVGAASASSMCRLDVRLSNTLARQFYLRRGFAEERTNPMFYRNEDGLTMSRPAVAASTAL